MQKMLYFYRFMILFFSALACSTVDFLRPFTIYPFVLAVLLFSLNEFIPLSHSTLNTYNVHNSKWSRYVLAMNAVIGTTIILFSLASVISLFDCSWNLPTNETGSLVTNNVITSWLLTAPVVYIVSLM